MRRRSIHSTDLQHVDHVLSGDTIRQVGGTNHIRDELAEIDPACVRKHSAPPFDPRPVLVRISVEDIDALRFVDRRMLRPTFGSLVASSVQDAGNT